MSVCRIYFNKIIMVREVSEIREHRYFLLKKPIRTNTQFNAHDIFILWVMPCVHIKHF